MIAVNHVPIVTRFFGELTAGSIEGIRPMAALSQDVYNLYAEWATRAELPFTALHWVCRFLNGNYGIQIVRRRYADGAFIRGPHSIMFLAGRPLTRRVLTHDVIGRQVCQFRSDVTRYIERGDLLAPVQHLPEQVQ